MACLFQPSNEINSLPENILLEIFKLLPIKDLCTIGRVCKKWRRVIDDNSLWRRVDLRPYKLNLHKMWKVIRAHFSDVLRSLHLRGYTNPASVNWKKHSLSDAMLGELRTRCPGLSELELVWTSLEGISVRGLPTRLATLTITDSLVPAGWFHAAADQPFTETLTHLDLSRSTRTSNTDLADIARAFTLLTTLRINFCYRVGEPGLVAVAEGLGDLQVLEIAETRCSDVCLHRLSRACHLETLDISGCPQVTDAGLAALAPCLSTLTSLRLVKCEAVTDAGLRHLTTAKAALQECDVTRTAVTDAGRQHFTQKLPKCHLVWQDNAT